MLLSLWTNEKSQSEIKTPLKYWPNVDAPDTCRIWGEGSAFMHLCSRQGGLTDTSQSDTQVSLPSSYSFLSRSVPPPYLLVFIHLPSQSILPPNHHWDQAHSPNCSLFSEIMRYFLDSSFIVFLPPPPHYSCSSQQGLTLPKRQHLSKPADSFGFHNLMDTE